MDNLDGCVVTKLAEEDEEFPSSQPATQPLFNQEESEEEDESFEDSKVWGTLYPLRYKLHQIALEKKVFSVGRGTDNDHVIGSDQAPKSLVDVISKSQFTLEVQQCGSVLLTDKSSNGTKINNKKVGKNKQRALVHNDEIKMADQPCYLFMTSDRSKGNDIPDALASKYVISKELGRGACGVVNLAFKNGTRCAVKSIDKNKIRNIGSTASIMNEAKLQEKIDDHPCIIKLYEIIETENFLYLVLEFAEGGELFDKIVEEKKFSEEKARGYFYQMLSAIESIHAKKITHRDLKPENILLCPTETDDHLIKISDLGLSKDTSGDTNLRSFVGTPLYLAPEVIVSKVRPGVYSNKVDMWALGVILYILLSGRQPFRNDRPDKALYRQVLDCDYSLSGEAWEDISPEAKDLIRSLLCGNVNQRLSATQAISHPWIANDQDTINKMNKIMNSHKRPDMSESLKRARSEDEEGELEFSNENQSLNAVAATQIISRPCKRQK